MMSRQTKGISKDPGKSIGSYKKVILTNCFKPMGQTGRQRQTDRQTEGEWWWESERRKKTNGVLKMMILDFLAQLHLFRSSRDRRTRDLFFSCQKKTISLLPSKRWCKIPFSPQFDSSFELGRKYKGQERNSPSLTDQLPMTVDHHTMVENRKKTMKKKPSTYSLSHEWGSKWSERSGVRERSK